MTVIAVDTSVAVGLLLKRHPAHRTVTTWRDGRTVALAGHALAETYSVLTRIPLDARLSPADAATLIEARFAEPLLLGAGATARLTRVLSEAGITGGATYDAMVALAAREHGATLATRDSRALPTYQALGVTVEIVG